jgi:hypothetical protein
MKRLVIALVCVCVLASASFAAKAKYLPTPTSAPSANSASNSGPSLPSIAAVGLYSQGLFFVPFAILSARFDISRNTAVEFGFGSSSMTGSDTNMVVLARYESNLTNKNNIRTYWAGVMNFINEGSDTITALNGVLGAEILINNQLGIYADATVLGLTWGEGRSTLGGGMGNPLICSGARIYL